MFIKNSQGDASKVKKFAKGTKFMLGGKLWTIKEAFLSDNTEMRRMYSDGGDDEIIMLNTLEQDVSMSKDFVDISAQKQAKKQAKNQETEVMPEVEEDKE